MLTREQQYEEHARIEKELMSAERKLCASIDRGTNSQQYLHEYNRLIDKLNHCREIYNL